MSDPELKDIRRNKLREFQKRLVAERKKIERFDADEILDKIFRGRAWEVFNAASRQHPKIMLKLKLTLIHLALSGRIKKVTGEQLYLFLRNLGLKVRLDTKIRFIKNGKLRSLSEKIKEDLSKG